MYRCFSPTPRSCLICSLSSVFQTLPVTLSCRSGRSTDGKQSQDGALAPQHPYSVRIERWSQHRWTYAFTVISQVWHAHLIQKIYLRSDKLIINISLLIVETNLLYTHHKESVYPRPSSRPRETPLCSVVHTL